MQIDHYLILAMILIGTGIGAALFNHNIVSIILSFVTAGMGLLLIVVLLDLSAPSSVHVHDSEAKGPLFALCLVAVFLSTVVLGCAISYLRLKSDGTINIDEKNQLRH